MELTILLYLSGVVAAYFAFKKLTIATFKEGGWTIGDRIIILFLSFIGSWLTFASALFIVGIAYVVSKADWKKPSKW